MGLHLWYVQHLYSLCLLFSCNFKITFPFRIQVQPQPLHGIDQDDYESISFGSDEIERREDALAIETPKFQVRCINYIRDPQIFIFYAIFYMQI